MRGGSTHRATCSRTAAAARGGCRSARAVEQHGRYAGWPLLSHGCRALQPGAVPCVCPCLRTGRRAALIVLALAEPGEGGSGALASCCVVGGSDGVVSVWRTHHNRPMAVLRGAFEQGVTDASWGPDGTTLLCCSLDGTLLAVLVSARARAPRLTALTRCDARRSV